MSITAGLIRRGILNALRQQPARDGTLEEVFLKLTKSAAKEQDLKTEK